MKAFVSYSHKDSDSLDRLHVHLAMLRREDLITEWFDRDILAGDNVDSEISEQLESCELFLLLVSPDFLNSSYCVEREMKRAMERHESNDARVIPIIIQPCDWKSSPFQKLKVLPRDGAPVSEWTNENNAFLDIVTELRRVLESNEGASKATSSELPNSIESDSGAKRYRVKRDFDEIDRGDFRNDAFATIRDYFCKAAVEIDGIEGLRGRFTLNSPTSFGCTIVNKSRDSGTAHITVHNGRGNLGMGDIYFSFTENASDGTANGWFDVEADEYELYLKRTSFGSNGGEERHPPEGAAESLWIEFLQDAGVSNG